MSKVQVWAWYCDRHGCGKVWLAEVKPKACAKCKSRKWDLKNGAETKPTPEPEAVPPMTPQNIKVGGTVEWYPDDARAAQDKLARERLARINASKYGKRAK
jgi:hypothetical protein